MDNDKALKLAKAAFTESTTYFDAGIRKQIERDMRQAQGLHPLDSKYESQLYRGRSRFFDPKTRSAIRKGESITAAAFFSQKDVVSIDPENEDDPANVAGARLLNEILNIRLRKSVPWFQTLIGAYQDARTVGICISYQHWRTNEAKQIDKPFVDLRPVENFRMSPGCDWRDPVGTSPYLIDMLPMYVKDVRARMETADDKTGEPKWIKTTDEELQAASARYSDSIKMLREKGRTDPQNNPSEVSDFTQVWVHRNIVEIDGEDFVYYTLSDIALLSKPQKLKEMYLHNCRPYAVGTTVIETHKLYVSGLPRLSADVQGMTNELRNLRVDNIRYALNPRYFVKRGAQVDVRSIVSNVPGSVSMVGNVEDDVKVRDVADVTGQAAFQEQDRLNNNFDEVAGTFSQSSVQGNKTLSDTLGGLEMLTNDANQIAGYELKTFAETWVKQVVRQLVSLVAHYETDEAILKLAGRKAEVTEIDDSLLLQEISVRVDVGIGAVTPQKRLGQLVWALKSLKEILADGVLQQAGLDLEEVATEIFNKIGYDSGARFFKWGDEQDPQVAMLNQKIAELQDSLKKKDPPEIVAAKVKLMQAQVDKMTAEKVKVGIEGSFGAMQAAEVIAAVPGVAPIADQLMRAAGYQTPVPVGIDPGFAPGEQGPNNVAPANGAGLTPGPVSDPRTGMSFTPGGASSPPSGNPAEQGHPLPAGMPVSTNPMTPKPMASPASGGVGFEHGIETVRPDSGKKK